ncbi:MAG: plasmid partitioning protein RepA [Proteobacteria bacterium]|nr:plasmid partitioning protein RepA [Pseudomonadota bacterium]
MSRSAAAKRPAPPPPQPAPQPAPKRARAAQPSPQPPPSQPAPQPASGLASDIDSIIGHHARELSEKLQAHRLELFPPAAQKTLRPFQASEAAKLLGVNSGYLRNLALEGRGPEPAVTPSGRRSYTAAQIQALRRHLDETGRPGRRYLPWRRDGEALQVVAVVNFKGGSGKTTTAAHLAQHLALRGHRVLAIDLDPQASLSSLHGFQPEFDVGENETLYAAIRYDERVRPLAEVIRRTNFPGLDIVPGNIELMEFEYDTPRVLASGLSGAGTGAADERLFFTRLQAALTTVADDYDVVVIDCPPQLGYLTMSALCTATAILITVHPQMLDVMSMSQFLLMMGDLLSHLKRAGGNMGYDWLRYLVTRYEPSDGPQTQMVGFLRSLFGQHVLTHPMVKSVAIADAGITKQTLYEVERRQFTAATYDRAMEALDAVNGEIEQLIHAAWGRR